MQLYIVRHSLLNTNKNKIFHCNNDIEIELCTVINKLKNKYCCPIDYSTLIMIPLGNELISLFIITFSFEQ